jgi:hypothetical protein
MTNSGEEPDSSGDVPPILAPPMWPPPPPASRPRSTNSDSSAAGLLGVMAVVAAGLFLALKLGFVLHSDPQPWPISSTPVTFVAAVVFATGMVSAGFLAAHAGRRASERRRLRDDAERTRSAAAVARSSRVANLAANPATAKYARLVERGENWSDEDIAYAEDAQAVATCEHLLPIERTMRAAGVAVRPLTRLQVNAKCRIDMAALQSQFDAGPPVRYAEFYAADRRENDNPTAFLICDAHRSIIHTLHPNEAGATGLPLFPSQPA